MNNDQFLTEHHPYALATIHAKCKHEDERQAVYLGWLRAVRNLPPNAVDQIRTPRGWCSTVISNELSAFIRDAKGRRRLPAGFKRAPVILVDYARLVRFEHMTHGQAVRVLGFDAAGGEDLATAYDAAMSAKSRARDSEPKRADKLTQLSPFIQHHADEPTPEQRVITAEMRAAVRAAVAALPKVARLLLATDDVAATARRVGLSKSHAYRVRADALDALRAQVAA